MLFNPNDDSSDKYLPASRVIEILQKLPPDSRIHPSRVGDLAIFCESEMIGVISFYTDGELYLFKLKP